MKKIWSMLIIVCLFLTAAGCKDKKSEPAEKQEDPKPLVIEKEEDTEENSGQIEEKEVPVENIEEEQPKQSMHKVAIDPGHQAQGNSQQEPIGPGATETKAKVASGTRGVSTGVNEYELTLAVSLSLEAELKNRGYEVVMIRSSNDVDLSNAERAQTANESGAEVFVRIHANGSENQSVSGALTMCMTQQNLYNAHLYPQSRKLSETVLNSLCSKTGAIANQIIETDTMSGINWCTIPVTIVEMGYMTNSEEDVRMQTPEYQSLLASGIADGIDAYFVQ